MSKTLKEVDDMPEWKKKHLAEQERRMREADSEKESERQREEQRLREIESAKEQAEQERLRLASENAERRKREDEEEMRRKTLEAQESGAAAKAERDSILQDEGLLKKKTNNGPLSPRSNPTPSPTPLTQNKSPESTANLPEWKRKKLEQEAAEKKRVEEEAKAKAAKLASLEPVFEVK